MSGDQCRFQHGPPKAVHSISEVDPSVYNMSEVESLDQKPEDESMAVEVYNRFDRFRYVPSGKGEYRYV